MFVQHGGATELRIRLDEVLGESGVAKNGAVLIRRDVGKSGIAGRGLAVVQRAERVGERQ